MTHRLSPLTLALLAASGLFVAWAASQDDRVALVRTPYLQTATGHSMVVRWRTDRPVATTLRYGTTPDHLTWAASSRAAVTEHEVKIDGLAPATRYYYAVGEGERVLAGGGEEHQFTTAPPAGAQDAVRFWVVGDSGQCAVAREGCVAVGAVRDAYLRQAAERPADLWLMLGDNAYWHGTDEQYTKGLFEVYPAVLRRTPLWTTLGNHDAKSSDGRTGRGPYFDAFTLPTAGEAGGVASGSEAYYAFDWGNIHFVSIDSSTGGANLTADGAMYQWLKADLQRNREAWTIVFWHHPPYTKGSHDSDDPGEEALFEMRQRFGPLIESYGADLMLAGHSHSYERSRLIDGHYGSSAQCAAGQCALDRGNGDPDGDGPYRKATLGPAPHQGTVYAVVGSSSKTSGLEGRHPVMAQALNVEGSLLVDVEGNRLDARFIDREGRVRDRFRMLKGGH